MNTDHNFSQALSWMIVNGGTISLTLNGLTRTYHKDSNGDIVCVPNGKEEIAYKVKDFKIDAVLSNNWQLLTDETNKE